MTEFTLDPFPTWTAEELRPHLTDILRGALGADRDRLKALDCASWLPDGVQDAAQLEYRGLPHGPVVQVVALLASAGDETHGKTMRVMIPNRLSWQDVERLGRQMAITIRNAVARMRVEEAQRRGAANVLTEDAPRTELGKINPLSHAIGHAVAHASTLH